MISAYATRICRTTLLVAAFLLPASFVFSAQTSPHRTHAIVDWSADLTGTKDASGVMEAVQTRASGKATASVDFDHQSITFNVAAKDITGVRKIEVREARSKGDLSGPTIFIIYDSHDGPFNGSVTKAVPEPLFKHVATPVANGQAVVVVSTTAHPDGEIAGPIRMHKSYE